MRLEEIRMSETDLVNFHLSFPVNFQNSSMSWAYDVLNVGPCVMKMMLVIVEQKKYIVGDCRIFKKSLHYCNSSRIGHLACFSRS